MGNYWVHAPKVPLKLKDSNHSDWVIAVDNFGYLHFAYYHYGSMQWRMSNFFINNPIESDMHGVKVYAWRYLNSDEEDIIKTAENWDPYSDDKNE